MFFRGLAALSRVEDYEWMLRYLKILDPVNARIIEGLGKYSPRNLSFLARKIGLPNTTVAFRVKKLMKEGFLKIRAKLNSPKLGLAKAVLVTEPNQGSAEALMKTVENVGYWTYIARCYGRFNGLYTLFSFPAKHVKALEDYFEKAKRLGALSDYKMFWTTNIFEMPLSFDWYDFTRKAWSFPWQKWVTEASRSSDQLPQYLADPESYEVQVDHRDLLILKELEKNALEDFTQLSKVVKITPQAVRHRFQEHIAKRNLITEYEIAIFPYPLQSSDLCAFFFDFTDKGALAKFANSLSKKPFVVSYAKIIGENSLIVHFYVPKTEFSKFMGSLELLTMKEIIRDFFYVSVDILSFKRQTVSYEYFHEGHWVYSDVEELAKRSHHG